MSLEAQGNQTFWWRIPGFGWDILGVPERFEKKGLCRNKAVFTKMVFWTVLDHFGPVHFLQSRGHSLLVQVDLHYSQILWELFPLDKRCWAIMLMRHQHLRAKHSWFTRLRLEVKSFQSRLHPPKPEKYTDMIGKLRQSCPGRSDRSCPKSPLRLFWIS